MGQGIYTAIVYGVIDPPTEETDEDGDTEAAGWYEDAERAAEGRHVVRFDVAYEAKPFYRGVVVAVSDRHIAARMRVPLFARYTMRINGLLDWVTDNAGPTFDRAIAAWEDIREAGRQNGAEVPEGELLLVCDWD